MSHHRPPLHEHRGHKEGEWKWSCCACPGAAPDPGCTYCLEAYYREHEPMTYRLFQEDAGT